MTYKCLYYTEYVSHYYSQSFRLSINFSDKYRRWRQNLDDPKKKKKKEFSFSRVRGIKQLDELSKNYQVLCHKLISSQHS